jgi:hypothetical protein
MTRTILVRRLALAAILSALFVSTPGAEEILHHGIIAESEGNVYDCLSCHDGLIALSAKISVNIGNFFCGHPVNRDYPQDKKSAFYLPIEEVTNAGIKLLNGQVTCISCHNLKNPDQYHLSVPLDKSSLCFTCHKI